MEIRVSFFSLIVISFHLNSSECRFFFMYVVILFILSFFSV